MTDDAELLRQYVQAGSEDAFTELVQRHLPVVYSSALRQTDGDVELAKDICQTVFIDFGRKAGSLLGHELLIGWLFSATRFAAATVLRANRRRQIRERIAVSMHEDAATPALECRDPKLASALDAAMEELTSEDRNAVLLRFFQGKDFKDVGGALGITEDAARMGVTRAIGKLHSLLESRGVTVSAAALGSILATEAVTAVPAGLATTICAAALSGTAITTAAVIAATKAIAMTTLQKTVLTTAIAVAVGTGIYEAHQAAKARLETQALTQGQAPLHASIQQLQNELNEATNRLAAMADMLARASSDHHELLALRGEVGRLRRESQEQTQSRSRVAGDAVPLAGQSWLDRLRRLKQRLEQKPEAQIPELKFLEDDEWRDAVIKGKLETDADYDGVLTNLCANAQGRFLGKASAALAKYMDANNDQFPTEVGQLSPFFETPPGDDLLRRYQIVPASSLPPSALIGNKSDWLLVPKQQETGAGSGWFATKGSTTGFTANPLLDIIAPAMKAQFDAAPIVDGRKSTSIRDLGPFLTTPEQKAAYQTLMEDAGPASK